MGVQLLFTWVRDTPVMDPSEGHALYRQGLMLLRAGRAVEAIGVLGAAIAALPSHSGPRVNLVRALLAAGDVRALCEAADAALRWLPDNAELQFARGTALSMLHQPHAALAALQAAIARDPSHAPSWLNIGNVHVDLDDLAAAECHIRAALRLDPALVEAHASLGFVLTARGRLREAIAACEAALVLAPEFAQAHWNLATAALLLGDFARGFVEYEWRKRHDRYRHDFVDLPGPVWTGDDPAGRTILVHAEQGLGDTIQLARYLPLIGARCGRAVLACERPLIPLLVTLPNVSVVPKDAALPDHDAWIDQMSLPRVFATRPETIPSAGGYLRADPLRVAAWRERLPPGHKIGLAWAGNPAHSNDRRRSLPPAALQRLLSCCGRAFISLQIGPRAPEAGLADLSSWLTDYAETAALVANLDLVLTVDTSVAHLAGALGVPCWVMLPYAPDWRWILGRDDTPWYRSLRLFRQQSVGDWAGVIVRIAAALQEVRSVELPGFERDQNRSSP